MPLHLTDRDVIPEVAGSSSALIVSCKMCPAMNVAAREGRPFIELFKGGLTSRPLAEHIRSLQSRLGESGVSTEVFKSSVPYQWFLCMWPSGVRNRLKECLAQHDSVIVLGCDTAFETVRGAVGSTDCRLIEGMAVAGFMNAKLRFRLPGTVSLEDCKTIPMSQPRE